MHRPVTRRSVLKGLCMGGVATLALPMLEMFLNGNGDAHADSTPLPIRFVLMFWGNGTRVKAWLPAQTGANYALSPVLTPYAPVKEYLSIVSGAQNKINGYVHHGGCAGMLSASPYVSSGTGTITTLSAPSLDQVVARRIGTGTRFPSLELGVFSPTKSNEGTTLKYLSHNGPNDVNPPETSPKALFARLFGSAPLPRAYGSVLDAVLADINALQNQVSAADKQRLEAYTTQVRAIETNLTGGGTGACGAPPNPGEDGGELTTVAAVTRRSNAMWSLMNTALACDLTRVVSVQYCGPSDCIQVPPEVFAGIPLYEGGAKPLANDITHGMTHNESTMDQPVVTAWSTFFQSQFANCLKNMVDTRDGDGNLLDNSAVFITSEVSEGRNHSSLHIPMLIAGRARGRLVHPGIHVAGNAPGQGAAGGATPANTYSAKGDIATSSNGFMNATDVHMTLLRAVGAPMDSYGAGGGKSTQVVSSLLTGAG